MKRFALIISLLAAAVSAASAQTLVRSGIHEDSDGRIVANRAGSTVVAEFKVEHRTFTPGIYARYAQKYLGVRASLAARSDAAILSASLTLAEGESKSVTVPQSVAEPAEPPYLPSNRTDARALSEEEHAAATAAMIFSLRKHRLDLITGELGENVFGAGLAAAIERLDKLESEYLAMFYGETSVSETSCRFVITPSAGEKTYPLCRFRADEGVVPLADLSGEAVVLRVEPSAVPDLSDIPVVDPKSKGGAECIAVNDSECVLLCGTRELAKIALPLLQYGVRVRVLLP